MSSSTEIWGLPRCVVYCAAGGGVLVGGALVARWLAQRRAAGEPTPACSLPSEVGAEATFDVIVVGAGSAGGVLAARVAEQSGASVLLLEAGGDDRNPLIQVPMAVAKQQTSELDYCYRTEPQDQACLGLAKQVSNWPRGRVLGGCSSMNYIAYVRGNPVDFDGWAASTGDRGWSWNSLLPLFAEIEERLRVTKSKDREVNLYSRLFCQAAQEAGFPEVEYNDGEQLGSAILATNTYRGRRINTAEGYVRPAMAACSNLTVCTNAFVTRILFDESRSRAVGVQLTTTDAAGVETRRHVYARREVVLCGGAINSPHLLLLSGIGPRSNLEAHGIPVVADLPGVGRHLQDHLFVPLKCRALKPGVITEPRAEALGSVLNYLLTGRGMLSSTPFESHVFTKSSKEASKGRPDLQLGFVPAGASMENMNKYMNFDESFLRCWGDPARDLQSSSEGLIGIPILLHPRSEGYLELQSTYPTDHPKIDPCYLSNDEDVAIIIEGVRETLRIMQQDCVKEYFGPLTVPSTLLHKHGIPEASPGVPATNPISLPDSFWEDYVRHMTLTLYHPV